MKTLLFTMLILINLGFIENVSAIPVITDAVGTAVNHYATLVPDSKNPNLYYYFPYVYTVSKDGDRVLFSYFETGYFWNRNAYVNVIFDAKISETAIQKMNEVKQANPNAVFSPIPVVKTSVHVAPAMTPLLSEVDCQTNGGVLEQPVYCTWRVKSSERESFRRLLRDEAQVQVMSLIYEFVAIGQEGKEQLFRHSPVMRIGVKLTEKNFYDAAGNPIKEE